MSESVNNKVIDELHNEIRTKIHNFIRKFVRKPNFVILNMDLWYDIQEQSKDLIHPEHIQEPDGFWRIYGLKVAILDGSNLQARHIEVA